MEQPTEAAALVAYVGLAIGSVAMLGVTWVWVQKQVFGKGGAVLSVLGVALIGLTVYSKVSISAEGIVLERQLMKLQEDNATLAASLLEVDEQLKLQRNQFVAIREAIPANPTNPQFDMSRFNENIDALINAEPIDRGRLEAIQERSELQNLRPQ